ncbi:hypothetical protein V8E54_009809 [Elaphomyces granulatus]
MFMPISAAVTHRDINSFFRKRANGRTCRRSALASSGGNAPPPPFYAFSPGSRPKLVVSPLKTTTSSSFGPPSPPPFPGDEGGVDDGATNSPSSTIVPPSPASSRSEATSTIPLGADTGLARASTLHPRVAVILGVDRKWHVPLLVCRALSTLPAAWWGLRCAFTFLAELLRIRPGLWREGWVAAIVGSTIAEWDVERRFRVTEVALAIMWVVPFVSCGQSQLEETHFWLRVQASKLQSSGCRDPSPGGERSYRLYHFLGFVLLRRLFRPASASTGMDIDNDDSYFSISCNSKPRHDQARDIGIDLGPLGCQLHKHVVASSTAPFDTGQ